MKRVVVIEMPLNLGLKKPSPDREPGVHKLPDWLRQHGFHKLIKADEVQTLTAPPYRMTPDPDSSVLNADAIAAYAKEQATLMKGVLSGNSFPVVTGGDCSILIGNAAALKQQGEYALFYLDGHTDFIGPEQSQTGAAGGMAAAIAAGMGHRKLTALLGQTPYFREQHVWCVGNREYDVAYERPLRESDAHYLHLELLRKTGVESCTSSFLAMVDRYNLDGFWVHLDVDVLDDAVMPAVDSRTPGGLSYNEFNKILSLLLASPKAAGIEITILDPDLDPTGTYTKEFVHNFSQTLNRARTGAGI
jgi:arginase